MGLLSRVLKGRCRDYTPFPPPPSPWDEIHSGIEWCDQRSELNELDDDCSLIHHHLSDSDTSSEKRPQLYKRLSHSIKSSAKCETDRLANILKAWSDKGKVKKWIAEGWPNPEEAFDETHYHAEVHEKGEKPARVMRSIVLYSPYLDESKVITSIEKVKGKW